ncbi:hypothetical protein F946_03173 [Acinetobacter johnsonii ANC 3681]|uniref:Uncharacterized protein n=1 Tax=Acinetobacter johnsonii ANC 3681 TaxID=1217662 RepID=N9CLW0_ACIJO|nr:hypothetical protein F946_03173 [Acinetobacter johnsonii ANC 3681]
MFISKLAIIGRLFLCLKFGWYIPAVLEDYDQLRWWAMDIFLDLLNIQFSKYSRQLISPLPHDQTQSPLPPAQFLNVAFLMQQHRNPSPYGLKGLEAILWLLSDAI